MPNRPPHAILLTLAGCLLCAAPALWVMSPVLPGLNSTIPGPPGPHFGDNVVALWNVWWFTEGVHVAGWPYWTPLLFAPFGTQLSLNTHATTHSLLAWPWTSAASVTIGHNLAMAIGLALNGACTFLLAFRLTGRLLPSVAAGLIFSGSAPVQVRVLGHINLLHAWVLPLFALALTHFMARPDGEASRRACAERAHPTDASRRAILLGASGALVAYTDYYSAVFSILLTAVWTAVRLFTVRLRRVPSRPGPTARILLALAALDLAVIATIVITGGTALNLGPLAISVRGLRNPLTLLWLLLAAWALKRFPVRLSAGWRGKPPAVRDWTPVLVALGVFAVLASPLILALLQVAASGGYSTQRVLWLSSPPGADLLTAFLGHPRHILTGEWTVSAYSALGIDFMEQSLWLGIIPVILLVVDREWRRAPAARPWIVAGIFFLLLALGPFLRVGGEDTALPLPQALLRYVPLFSNARIPGRAMLVVQLALAVLSAFALARWSNRTAAAVLLLLVLETFSARAPLQILPPPDAVDERLRTSSRQGAVAELPIGLRDGFGQSGEFEHRALAHQMWHERPLAGGTVSRLSPALRRACLASPALQELLQVSTPSAHEAVLSPGSASRAADLGIAFLVVNRDTFVDARLPRAALERAGFQFLEAAGTRELYATPGASPPRQ